MTISIVRLNINFGLLNFSIFLNYDKPSNIESFIHKKERILVVKLFLESQDSSFGCLVRSFMIMMVIIDSRVF